MLKIRIVHIIENLHFGGAQRFVIDLCNEVSKAEKYDVYIISLCENNPENSFVEEIESRVKYISFKKNRGLSFTALYMLTAWLKKECPHIVHSHLNALEYIYFYRLYDTRTSFFHTIHKPVEVECSNPFIRKLRTNSYRNNHVIPISVSQQSSRSFRDHYKLYNDIVIQLARPSLNISAARSDLRTTYCNDKNSSLIVHVGNIKKNKNQQLLLRAIQLYNRSAKKKCKLLMIGEVKDHQLFVQLREMANGDQNIEFIGPKHNVADYMSISDGFCLSSTDEGMPISLIEAMSLGCIPICTPVGVVKEMIVDGVTGFLSRGVEVESYCDALKRALDFGVREDIKVNLINLYHKKFHIKTTASNHINSYNKALNLFEGRDNAFELLYKSKM
jgi:glycosyltransferase involved in cell wall biosynthesis